MFKKISFFLSCLFALAVCVSKVSAQVDLPLLYVNDVKLEKNDNFNIGDSIDGYFTLVNKSNYDVVGAKVSYYLVSKDDETGLENFIVPLAESQVLDSIGRKSSRVVNFPDMKIPESYRKDSYIKVQLMTTVGMNLGWGYSEKLDVVNGLVPEVEFVGTRVRLDNDQTFSADHGPHIYKDRQPNKAFLEFLLSNLSENDTEVTAVLSINERSGVDTQKNVFKLTSNKFVIKSGEKEKVVSVELPSFDYKAGVYEGDSVLINKDGKEISSHVPFRYIVNGKILTIHSLTSDKSSVLKGEKFSVATSISGTPIDTDNNDIDLDKTEFYKDLRFDLKIKNEKGSVVAKDSKVIDNQNGVYNFDLTSGRDAKALTAELKVFSEGELVMTYNVDLSYNFGDLKSTGISSYWYLLFIVLIIVFGFVFFKMKNKVKVLVLFILFTLSFSVRTNAFTTVSSFSNMGASFDGGHSYQNVYVNIFVNTPEEEDRLNPKEAFSLTGSVQYPHCTNSSNTTSGKAWISDTNGVEVSTKKALKSVSNASGGSHSWSFPSYNLDPVAFNAPQNFGEYRLYTNATTTFDSWGTYTSILGYVNFFVVPFAPTNLTANAGASCSPDITLSWTLPTSMDGVEGFKLYRSTSEEGNYELVATIDPTETSYVDTLTSLVPGSFYYKLTAYDSESGLESDPATASYTYPPSCANGLCKTPPNNSDVTAEPVATTANLCDQGLLSTTEPFSSTVVRNESTERDQTTYNWKCVGTDENQKATCSATLQVTGLCTSQANLDSFNNINPSEMCDEGITAELKHTANGYTWKCYGSDPSRDVSCSFNDSTPVDGHCGTKNNQNVTEGYSFSETDLCLTGVKPVPSYADNTYTWACDGIEGGQSSGQCKAYTGSTQAECVTYPQGIENAPTGSGNLCVSGIAGDTVSSSGSKYIWSCASPDRTLVKICSANKSGYGVCGDRSYPLNTNQSLLCATGSTLVSSPSDQGDFYEWQCKGTNNNPDAYATCKSYKGPACATGLDFAEAPEANNSALCSIGTADEVVFNQSQNKFEWHCIKGNQTSSLCSATKTSVVPSIPAVSTGGRCNPQGVGQNIIDVTMTNTGGSLPVDYLVYRSTQSSNDIADYAYVGTVRMIRPNSLNLFADRNATPGTTYYYKVKAHNVAGDSGYSSKVFGSTPSVCRAPVSDCGVATERSMVYMPSMSTPDLCNVGAPSNFAFNSASSTFTWDCVTSSNTSECSAPKVDVNDVSCGSATASNFSSAPSITNPNLCNPGSASNVTEDSNGFSWKCSSADGSIETTCSASKACSGSCGGGGDYPSCGSAELVAMDSIPTENGTQYLCSSGTVVSGSISSTYGGYVWQCNLASKTTDCFAQKNGFVPPGVLCPSGSCIAEEGEVALRDLAAYPAIGNTGYQCTVFLGDQASSYSVFEKKDANTKCELTGPNGASIRVFSPNGEYQKTFPFTINTQSTYRLTCWQENDEGVKEQSSEVYKEVTCRINPSYVETSFIQRLFSNIRSMSASALNAFKSLFGSK